MEHPTEEKPEMMGEFKKWEVEDALRDIERSEMHQQNAELMVQVSKLAKKKAKAINSIADMKRVAYEKEDEE